MIIATSTVYGPDPSWNARAHAGKVKFATTPGWTARAERHRRQRQGGCFQPGADGAGFDALTNGSSSGKLFGFFAPGGAAAEHRGGLRRSRQPRRCSRSPRRPARPTRRSAPTRSSPRSAKTKSPKLVAAVPGLHREPRRAEGRLHRHRLLPVGTTDASALPRTYKPVASIVTTGEPARSRPVDWANGKVYADLGAGVQGILTGQKTAQQVLQQMDSDWG